MSEKDIIREEMAQMSSTDYFKAIKMATQHHLEELTRVEKEEEMYLKEDQENLERRQTYFKKMKKNMTPEQREYITQYLLFEEKDIKINRRTLDTSIERERAQLQRDLHECSKLLKEEEEKERQMVKFLESERKAYEKQEKR